MSKEKYAANKAAEEGELPLWHHNEYSKEMHPDPCGEWVRADTARFAIERAIAADRAARPVANKAEVEPVAWAIKSDGSFIFASVSKGAAQGWLAVDQREILPLYATPPATTGASTAGLESILDRLENAIGGYSGGPFDKVQAIIDELRAAPDCGACPGDGSMCKSRCKVEQESPASTVLTDERIEQVWNELSLTGAYTMAEARALFARAIEREVAAQAGQVAVPEKRTELDGWNAAAKALAERAAGHFRNKDFKLQDECLQCASMLHDLKPYAPSPAKESK